MVWLTSTLQAGLEMSVAQQFLWRENLEPIFMYSIEIIFELDLYISLWKHPKFLMIILTCEILA